MLEPKNITIKDMNGVEKTFIISKMTYFDAREVAALFITTAAPKIGDYKENQRLALILFSYVQVIKDGIPITLSTKTVVENHVDFKIGVTLEKEMILYNTGFFGQGEISNFLNTILVKAEQLITKTLMGLPAQSLAPNKQPSMNSKRSTRSKTPS